MIKAVVVLSILVLIRDYATRYIKCLQRPSTSEWGSFFRAGTASSFGSNVWRKLAVASEDANFTISHTGEDPAGDEASRECRREVREDFDALIEMPTAVLESDIAEQQTSNAVISARDTCRIVYGIIVLGMLFLGLGFLLLWVVRCAMSRKCLDSKAEFGAAVGLVVLTVTVLACLFIFTRRQIGLRRRFESKGAPKGPVLSADPGRNFESGERSETSFPESPVEAKGLLATQHRYSSPYT